jgi:hypothetical protein
MHSTGRRGSNNTDSSSIRRDEQKEGKGSSRARWDLLRQRVLVSGAESLRSPKSSPSASPNVSTTHLPPLTPNRAQTPPIARSVTPTQQGGQKLSRFARLGGFWQVVDGAREAAALAAAASSGGLEEKRFAEDVLRACVVWSPSSSTNASSTASLPLNPIPGSTYSLPTSGPLSYTYTLNGLYRLLLHYAPHPGGTAPIALTLPHESQVLAVLLVPFCRPSPAEEEKEGRVALDTFEVALRWRTETTEVWIGRCLWCCKAASVRSTHRIRILRVLWALVVPDDEHHDHHRVCTPTAFGTLVQGLFLLLYALSVVAPGEGDELALVRELVVRLVRPGGCELDRDALRDEYGSAFSRKDDQGTVSAALVQESVARCLENGVEGWRRWVLSELLQVLDLFSFRFFFDSS